MIRRHNRLVSGLLVLCFVAVGVGLVITGSGTAAQGADLADVAGTGTEDDPYVITTAEELQAINQDLEAHYVLGNDVDASETESWNEGAGFEPIGDRPEYGDRSQRAFRGSFDGQGHTISDLTIARPTEEAVGLFGYADGTIENVELENVLVRGGGIDGGLVGLLDGDVRGVYVTGTVVSEENGGGVVGWAGDESDSGSIERSGAAVDVSAETAGGLVGLNLAHTISESYATGDVEGAENAGGLIGSTTTGTAVHNGYATGSVSGERRGGGLVGWTRGPIHSVYATGEVADGDSTGGVAGEITASGTNDGSVTGGYWDIQTTDQTVSDSTSDVDTGFETSELTDVAAETNMDGLDFDGTWTLTDEYPVFRWQVEDVALSIERASIGEGETSTATVELTLDDGSTVTASEVAEYDSEAAVADVENGVLKANSLGQTDVSATIAGETATETVDVLEPPEISLVDAELTGDAVVEGSVIEATASYENDGGPGSDTAVVAIDDETVASSGFTLESDEEDTVTITWTADAAGNVTLDEEALGTLEVVEPGTVGLENVDLPPEVTEGEGFDVDVELSNDADHEVVETVSVRIDGEAVHTESVVVDAGGSTETITYAHGEVGTSTHVVAVRDDEETATTEILEPAEFLVDDLDGPESVDAGDTASINATVTNEGGSEDTAEVTLEVDGESIDSRATTLGPAESEHVEFDVTLDDGGDLEYEIATDDAAVSASLSVRDGDDDDVAESDDDGSSGFGAAAALLALGIAVIVTRSRTSSRPHNPDEW